MKTFALFLATAAVSLFSWNGWSAAPANDRFANRITLAGTNITVTGSNVGANKETGEPAHAGNPGGKSVWWTWTAPTNGDVTLTTDDSGFDTLLAVYTGSSVSALNVVATNDDHGVVVTSRVRFQAAKGTPYQIAVDGYNDDTTVESGSITLSLLFLSEPISRPANDNFANRTILSGAYVTTNASNVGATREPGEPLHTDQLPRMGDTSVWWSWTAPTATNVVITTVGSSLDTFVAIYVGSSLSNLLLVASNDDVDPADGILVSAVTLDTTRGQTYQIAVDGYDGASGQVVLRIASPGLSLSAPFRRPDRTFQLTLDGVGVGPYEVQASADLRAWTSLGTLLKTNLTTVFIDPAAASADHRLYRARPQP